MRKSREYDVVVAGAGSTGSAAAYNLARSGLSVALLDARPFGEAGACWANTVIPWMFARAGIPDPEPPELLRDSDEPVLVDPVRGHLLRLGKISIFSVDMRLLVARLQRLARAAGADCFERTRVSRFTFRGQRPVALHALRSGGGKGGAGREQRFPAKLFVDATGMSGALRSLVPALSRACPPCAPRDTCAAVQRVHAIRDEGGARAFLDRLGTRQRESPNLVGAEGGFSILTVHVDGDFRRVHLLAGTIADGARPTGAGHLAAFLAREPWIGEPLSGGGALIPLRRPYDVLGAPGIVLAGDAGCMVFPAHGSGVGYGMIAGRMIAEAAQGRGDPGSREATWSYQASFLREVGPVSGAFDVMRRFIQPMSPSEMSEFMASGLMSRSASRCGILQKLPETGPGDLLRTSAAAVRSPRLAVRVGQVAARMGIVHSFYRLYPRKPSPQQRKWWSEAVAKIFDE